MFTNETDICVIFNPASGRGRALGRVDRLRRRRGPRADFRVSRGPGHAEELALEAARDGFTNVVAAGGDGTLHEVTNGLLRAGRPVSLALIPIGSANDYASSLGQDARAWLRKGAMVTERRVDIGWVRSGCGRERYFINGLGLGFNGAVTMEARRIRGLQGVPLYTLALVRALWNRYTFPRMVLSIDGEQSEMPTLAFSAALGRREGNFVLAPNAVLDDGLFDYLHAGPIGRLELLRYVPGMITGRLPAHPHLRFGRCKQVQVESEAALPVHLDGEMFSVPRDNVRELEIRIMPGALRVLTVT
jgi:diacylglycerol kinase (ATP)